MTSQDLFLIMDKENLDATALYSIAENRGVYQAEENIDLIFDRCPVCNAPHKSCFTIPGGQLYGEVIPTI